MGQFKNKSVLITGASAGIGKALARDFFEQGANVWLFARRRDRLEEIAREIDPTGSKVKWMEGDVTSEQSLTDAVKKIHANNEKVDVVIANAGCGVMGSFESLPTEMYRRQLEVNVFGVLNTVRATLDDLKATQGRIVIISSVNGYVSVPGASAYAMSKFALQAFGDAVRLEVRSYGISLTMICPGFVESEFRHVTNFGTHNPDAKDPIPSWILMPSRVAARKIRKAAYRRVAERPLTIHGWGVIFLKRHFPWVVRFLFTVLGVRARGEVVQSSH